METNTSNNRWIIHRIGLINFWYYDEEEFHFNDGRLLLRGSNGSGKSVTMQSFIPLLLDGNKSPERLDPFGSRARKLENYLLGEDEKGKDESTGYLYMEFCKPDTGVFITIGMGLRARQGKSLDFWGFSITDGRRIGKDFLLYKDMGEKIPLSKIELRNRIATGGELHEGQKDYMAMVNRLLFGFENIEDYDELIKLLIQIRTPKLSKDFKPTVIYDIMNNSLQPLSDDDLRPMSEAIENMDNIKTALEMLKQSKTAADRLKNEYHRYNKFVLFEKARDFVSSQDKLDVAKNDLKRLETERNEYQQQFTTCEETQQSLKARQQGVEHKKQQLEKHDSFRAKQEIDKLETLLKELEGNKTSKEKSLGAKRDRERQLNSELKTVAQSIELQEEGVKKLVEEMSSYAEDIRFYEHDFAKAELLENLKKEYNFKLLRDDVDRYREKLLKTRKALEQEKNENQNYDRALGELETVRREREDARRELEKADNVFIETKEELIEQAHLWEKGNEFLKLPSQTMTMISRAVHAYGEESGYDNIIEGARSCYLEMERGHNKEIAEVQAAKSGLAQQMEKKHQELEEWKKQKDPEPKREDKVLANRQRLCKENIPHVPLYSAVDFKEGVSEEIRGRLEEALLDMGLLDALIVPKPYQDSIINVGEDMGDRYLSPSPQFLRQDLSMLLKPVVVEGTGVAFEDIDNVLKSILLDKQGGLTHFDEKGHYTIGILQGKTSSCYLPRFIGAEARKRYRQENISRLEAEILEIKEWMQKEEEKILEIKTRLGKIKSEFESFPGKKDIETAYNRVYTARMALEARIKEYARREEAAERIHKNLKDIRERVRELGVKIEIALSLEAYEQAEKDAGSYRDLLGNLETLHTKLNQFIKRFESIEEQMEEILGDIDEISFDLGKINREMKDRITKKQNHEALLKELNYDEIKHEIEECIRALKEIPEQIERAIRDAQAYKGKYETTLERLEKLKEDMHYLETLNECLKEGFHKEYVLMYVVKYEEEQSDIQTAKKVVNQLKGEEKEGKLREDYAEVLQERYHQNMQYFTEYYLRMEHIFDREKPYEDERLSKVVASQKRLELTARIQGRDVNFLVLVEFIEQSIEENEKLLRESDRQLFEDILANTVGKKIRAKIYHSEQWVKKMNSLMESMNTSSGLSFSLNWKNRTAQTEEQIDTRELVDILKSDAGLLKEEDMEKLSMHFRSKIAQARKELEDKGAMQTFHAIMRDILDYRKWFEFQLFFKKTGETRKELTNNAFDKFSGGEKAMAMYVPLFSAVYARYDGGRKDCPRVISLDEAFAGVDEKNICDMFRLMEELRLNFIINSQILWGDYETVPALSICELLRPNNADFVTVMRYRWNGRIRELVTQAQE